MSDDSAKRESIFAVLDDLIFHLNTTRSMFTFLIVSSFILAPAALILAAVFVLNPEFLAVLLKRAPQLGTIIITLVGTSVVLAAVWLYIGIRERRFFSRWNGRFSRFMSLKERIDKELGD